MTILFLVVDSTKKYDHPNSFFITNFKAIAQPNQIACGPTCISMVLERYKVRNDLNHVINLTKTKWFSFKGEPFGLTIPDYMIVSMNTLGVKAKQRNGNLDRLKHFISQNKPVIVLVRGGFKTWHYLVVIGYDKETVTIADPYEGEIKVMSSADFVGCWNFTSDINGRKMVKDCNICKGTGKWINPIFGPFSICDVCGGSGKQIDYMNLLLRSADIYNQTMIVPDESLSQL